MKVNNILSFKDFTELKTNKKSTKRTEVGGDVLNENFYDKLSYKIEHDLPLDNITNEFYERVIKAAKHGQVKNINEEDDFYSFLILNKQFKVFKDGTVQFSTPKMIRNKEPFESEFKISTEQANDIIEALDNVEY